MYSSFDLALRFANGNSTICPFLTILSMRQIYTVIWRGLIKTVPNTLFDTGIIIYNVFTRLWP